MMFRDLTESEIEIRVGQASDKGVSLLLYKDARCDMAILDETVGAENWQREHYDCKGNLFCRVGIRCDFEVNELENGNKLIAPDWVWKSDCGVESNTEAQKGEASDSFKRACVNWGIGRELYTAPFIWVKPDKVNLYDTGRKDKFGKPVLSTKDKFVVEKIVIENKKIVGLSIVNMSIKSDKLSDKRVFVMAPRTGE